MCETRGYLPNGLSVRTEKSCDKRTLIVSKL